MKPPYKVAYLGPAATFSHEAARLQFGMTADYLPCRSIPEVFMTTARHEADYGIVPVENAIEGGVTFTLDMFARPDPLLADLRVWAEVNLPIVQNLLVAGDGPTHLDKIELIYYHPQALAQCRLWLNEHVPQAQLHEVLSTALSAQMAASNPRAAGIANRLAAEQYGLRVLATDLQEADFNQTRFFVIGSQPLPTNDQPDPNAQPNTAIMISIKDRVGALHAVTSIFVKYGLNMNRIESRPSKQKAWDYLFFIDFIGHPSQTSVAAALRELNNETDWVRLLGSWLRTAS